MAKYPLQPASDYYLVKHTPLKQDTALIVQTPPTATGIICAVGEDGKYASEFKEGDSVLHTTVGYETFTSGEDEYRLIPFPNVIAKLL